MRLLAVVMSVTVVAGAAGGAQTQRTTPEPKTAPAPVSTAVDKGARWLASRARRRRRVGPGRRRGALRAAGRAAGIERQRRRQHGGRGPCAPAGRQAVRAAGGARTRICPAADRGESSRRPGNHRSPGHADPAKAGPVHRHVSLVDADVADRRTRVDAGAERSGPQGAAEDGREDREASAVGRKLEHCWRLGAGARHVDGLAQPLRGSKQRRRGGCRCHEACRDLHGERPQRPSAARGSRRGRWGCPDRPLPRPPRPPKPQASRCIRVRRRWSS